MSGCKKTPCRSATNSGGSVNITRHSSCQGFFVPRGLSDIALDLLDLTLTDGAIASDDACYALRRPMLCVRSKQMCLHFWFLLSSVWLPLTTSLSLMTRRQDFPFCLQESCNLRKSLLFLQTSMCQYPLTTSRGQRSFQIIGGLLGTLLQSWMMQGSNTPEGSQQTLV